jgi:hypothetical protein
VEEFDECEQEISEVGLEQIDEIVVQIFQTRVSRSQQQIYGILMSFGVLGFV